MHISLTDIGRRYNREWIFKGLTYTFNSGQAYAILGPNGSGKSTLLQILSGSLAPSTGHLQYSLNGQTLLVDDVYEHISMAAPYMELIEDFTLTEMIHFHFGFKHYRQGMDAAGVIELLNMQASRNKPIRYFSSGMKQRAKLALAFCADTPMLLLDEPTSNLDAQGVEWYQKLVSTYASGRLCIISSNIPAEYEGVCTQSISITQYKQ